MADAWNGAWGSSWGVSWGSGAAPVVETPQFRGTGGWGAGLGWPLSKKKRTRQEEEEDERRERAKGALDRVLEDVLVTQPARRERDRRDAEEAEMLFREFDELEMV